MSIRKNEVKSYSYIMQDKVIKKQKTQSSCKQCGICCIKGGAALHNTDLHLLQKKKIPRKDCVILRKGEFAWTPVTERVEAIKTEIIKLRGTGGEWVCCYYNPVAKNCGIYADRPIACRTLKCWEPERSLAIAGKDLLSRREILQLEPDLLEQVSTYEEQIQLPDFDNLVNELKNNKKSIKMLEDLINKDLIFRDKAIQLSAQVSEEELFLFGRPVFQLLQPFGLQFYQKGNRLCLK